MPYTIRFSRLAALVALTVLTVSPVAQAEAQFGKRLKDAVKRTAEDKAIQKTTEEEGKAIDTLLSGGGEAARPADSATAPGEGAAAAPAGAAKAAPAAGGGETASAKPGEGVWANYDFKPGERVLFTEDFTKDEVGDFPRRIELKEGNMEVVEWQGGRYLRSTSYGSFSVPLPEPLPERFTLEFDYSGAGDTGWPLYVYVGPEEERPDYLQITPTGGGVKGSQTSSYSETSKDLTGTIFPVRLMVDGSYAKLYVGDKRVANVPNAKLGRSNKLLFKVAAVEKDPVLITNIRVAAGGKKLYDALAEKGRVATQGIYFDTGSDRIRPESSGTLKEIGTMLKEHPELKLTIEGHTDNVGSAPANQTLSEKRAAAVRQSLIDTYQVDAARLQAKGLGSTAPAGSNDTPEGRQQNRRVELVKA
jgi:outer membrane protein OmpA-like peptidoglycan-associated protein